MQRQGIARLVAEVVGGRSVLTEVSHRSPARLHAMSNPMQRDAAWCTLGGFGGGVVGGDRTRIDVDVRSGATLALFTQGSTKLYKAKRDGATSQAELNVRVRGDALLVFAPDPLVPYRGSRFAQRQRFELEPGASAVVVDACMCGRAALATGGGERWEFDEWASRTEFHAVSATAGNDSGGGRSCRGGGGGGDDDDDDGADGGATPIPFLADATRLRRSQRGQLNWAMDMGGVRRNVFATVNAVGSRAEVRAVVANLEMAAIALARRAGARVASQRANAAADRLPPSLASAGGAAPSCFSMPRLEGAFTLGISDVMVCDDVGVQHGSVAGVMGGGTRGGTDTAGTRVAVTARLVAELPEDLTRLLHACLAPLERPIGMAPYSNRLHASSNATLVAPSSWAEPGSSFTEPGGSSFYEPGFGSAAREEFEFAGFGGKHSASAENGSQKAGQEEAQEEEQEEEELVVNRAQLSALLQLSDATLPTGGFAHSGGLEAGAQLRVLGDYLNPTALAGGAGGKDRAAMEHLAQEELAEYLVAATVSHTALHAPFTSAAYRLASAHIEEANHHLRGDGGSGSGSGGFGSSVGAAAASWEAFVHAWAVVDAELNALLCGNAPGCRASRAQGSALTLATCAWLQGDAEALDAAAADGAGGAAAAAAEEQRTRAHAALQALRGLRAGFDAGRLPHGHAAPVMGVVGAALGLDVRSVLDAQAFSVSRDMLAAAVRLNLVGPIAAIPMQAALSRNIFDAKGRGSATWIKGPDAPTALAASASPLVDAAHASHDMLEMRLFQT
jgi:urease accessory protein UreF